MVCRHLVHVAGGVEVALAVVEGAVGDAFFGVCAIPGFAEVLCAAVDAAERGFDGALVCVGAAGLVGCLCGRGWLAFSWRCGRLLACCG